MAQRSSAREVYLSLIEGRPEIDGRFSRIKRIGAEGGGGMFSLVFTAEDSKHGSQVALKFFNPERAGDPYRLECFQREASLLQSLGGQRDILESLAPESQVVEIVTTAQGLRLPISLSYYALEYAPSDVRRAIANDAWDHVQILTAFRAMCRAVQRIHARRVVHRDLKPDNFLVMGDGSVKLGDFGAAALLDGSPHLRDGYAFQPGDVRYVAPEMIACLHDDRPEVAFGADYYSLGAILFELFSGQILGLEVFDPGFLDDLGRTMGPVDRNKRRAIYDQFVDQIVAGRPLPSLRGYAGIPDSIVDRLDNLYRGLAHLDYRQRLVDPGRIFNEVNVCGIILRKEKQYQHWRLARQARRAAALARNGDLQNS